LQAEQRFNGIGAYNSKLAIVLFTYELARRLEGTGVTVNCVHPGVVRSTALGRGERFALPVRVAWTLLRPFMKSPTRAREHVGGCGNLPGSGWCVGPLLANCREARTSRASYDRALAERLWAVSASRVGLA
jgi:retinol dehydrogenase-14